MCLRNSAVLQGYMDKLNTDADNEAEPRVYLNNEQDDINKIKCEIKLEDEELYTVGLIIDETEAVYVNVDISFGKVEDTWNREEVEGEKEPLMDNNPTESSDNEWVTEMAVNTRVNRNTRDTDSSEATSAQGHTTNKRELNTPVTKSHKCLTCSKSFSSELCLHVHARVHTGETPYKCSICEKCSSMMRHMRTHTGEKPYKCALCERCFAQQIVLVHHMRTHTGERPYKCTVCDQCFIVKSHLVHHLLTHIGEKPDKCATCDKCFARQSNLVRHILV